ncbi:MAG: putative HTH-type transcriptional regulator [Methanonatronarchaeales archaeon]|nr:putative HTH-type transcriptional regulator [Methanonatronarchaeales archaeon]
MSELATEDKLILDRLQSDFPLTSRPFDTLGEEVGIEGPEVLRRVRNLSEEGYIRRLAPVLSSRKIGYGAAALVAVRVDGDRIEETADFISRYSGVTHNYERAAPGYNLWFTLHARDGDELERVIDEVRENTPAEEVLPLPATRVFGIGVRFDIEGGVDDDR